MFTQLRHRLFSPWGAAFLFLLLFALWSRLAWLGTLPIGLNWDETALGYIGKMVITTGRDEYNQRLPRVFQSFGDYKAPFSFYLTGLSTTALGLNAWAVRLPFALAGVGSIFAMVWITNRVLKNPWLALAGGWLLAISPWHLLLSRVAFESGLSLFFLLLMLGSWLELRQRKQAHPGWWVCGVLSAFLALATYHSARIVIPLTLLTIGILEWKINRAWVRQHLRTIGASGVVLTILSLPLLATLLNHGAERAAQTMVFSQGLPMLQAFELFLRNFFHHLSLPFLIQGETSTLRHGTGERGVLLLSQLALLLLGVTFLIARTIEQSFTPQGTLEKIHTFFKARFTTKHSHDIPPLFWLVLMAIGLLPAAIGFEVPHSNRALLALPFLLLIMGYAIQEAQRDLTELTFSLLTGMLLLFSLLEFASFWSLYQYRYRVASAKEWLYGYTQIVPLAWEAKQAGKSVKVSSAYGQPEIFFGFSLNLPPETYRWERVPGITFGHITPFDEQTYQFIVAAEGERLPQRTPSQIITRPDGSTAFFIYESP